MSCIQNLSKLVISPVKLALDENLIGRNCLSVNYQLGRLTMSFKKSAFVLTNKEGLKISCFIISPKQQPKAHNVILYLHGNGGTKLQALQLISFTGSTFTIVAFDFLGCGKSDGQFITYGQNEKQQINFVLKELKQKIKFNSLSLWGRSMGAVCAIEFMREYPQQAVQSLILDSPFRSLQQILENAADKQDIGFLCKKIGMFFIKRRVVDFLNHDIFKIDYAESIASIVNYDNKKNIPMFFAYSNKDSLVKFHNFIPVFQSCKGQKSKFQMNCGHNEERSDQFYSEAVLFLIKITNLQVEINVSCLKKPIMEPSSHNTTPRKKKNCAGLLLHK